MGNALEYMFVHVLEPLFYFLKDFVFFYHTNHPVNHLVEIA